jgi:uncharacterized protein
MELIPRVAGGQLEEFASGLRVVIVNGPRQCGKTTLLRQFHQAHGGTFSTLDDNLALQAALADPRTFVGGGQPHVIDEVQRGGDPVVLAIKQVVDESQARGQFILAGSTRFLAIPTLSESLAGRAGFVDLWPLAMSERTRAGTGFCDLLFTDPDSALDGSTRWSRGDYLDQIVVGGYPEAISIGSHRVRQAWYDGYLATVTSRDIADFVEIHRARALPQLLELLAARAGSPVVVSDLAQSVGLSREITRNYLRYLMMVFLVAEVPAWSTNLTTKVARTPKIYPTDSGLAARLLQLDADGLRTPGHPGLGGLVETFVFNELTKLQTFSATSFTVRHLRERDGREIDFILEARDGRVVGVEVKASASPVAADGKHLMWLRDRLGDRFVAGVVLHLGDRSASFGDRVLALPMSALWAHAEL